MYDPEELNSKIAQSFKKQEQVEAEAKQLENKLLENYEFNKSMLPARNWGQPFDSNKLTMTAKFIIEKHQPEVASYLGFNSGYHSRQKKLPRQEKKLLQEWQKELQLFKNKI